jgi:hypothetical protein
VVATTIRALSAIHAKYAAATTTTMNAAGTMTNTIPPSRRTGRKSKTGV